MYTDPAAAPGGSWLPPREEFLRLALTGPPPADVHRDLAGILSQAAYAHTWQPVPVPAAAPSGGPAPVPPPAASQADTCLPAAGLAQPAVGPAGAPAAAAVRPVPVSQPSAGLRPVAEPAAGVLGALQSAVGGVVAGLPAGPLPAGGGPVPGADVAVEPVGWRAGRWGGRGRRGFATPWRRRLAAAPHPCAPLP